MTPEQLEKKRLIKRLDTVFSLIVRERDKYTCQKCGRKHGHMQTAHFYSRKIKVLRWETLNAVCLCGGCHFWAHQNPSEFCEWFEKHVGARNYQILQTRRYNRFKTSVQNLKIKMMELKGIKGVME